MATYGRRAVKRKQSANNTPLAYTSHPKRSKVESLADVQATELPTLTTPPSTGKITKRMLGRSRTETSIGSMSASFLSRAPSLPATLPTINSSSDTLPIIPEPTTPPRPIAKLSRTYAGASRTFLVALPATGLTDERSMQQEDDAYSRESYSALRARYGIDQSSDDDRIPSLSALAPSVSFSSTMSSDSSSTPSPGKSKGRSKARPTPEPLAPGMMNPLKSISELRSKGENRRFMDDVGYLFEGMNKEGPLALRRASALEIINNLCDAEFHRKARAADFIGHSWELFSTAGCGAGEDKVLDLLLVLFSALISRDTPLLDEIVQRFPDAVPSLFELWTNTIPENDPLNVLSTSTSPTPLRHLGYGKKDQGILNSIHALARKHINMTDVDIPMSTSSLLAYALSSVSPALLPPAQINALLVVLKQELKMVPPAFSQDLTPSYEAIHPALKLLNSYMLGQWGGSEDAGTLADVMEDETWFANGLIDLAICAERHQPKSSQDHATKCLDYLLRILVSVSHSDQRWCSTLIGLDNTLPFILREMSRADHQHTKAMPGIVKKLKMEDSDATEVSEEDTDLLNELAERALDRLCLCLGLLTNLLLDMDDFGNVLLSTSVSQICALLPKPCTSSSLCPHKMSTSLEILFQVYSRHRPAKGALDLVDVTSPNPDIYFLLGHLSILFGMLLRSCPGKRDLILDDLPLEGDHQGKLEQLIDQAGIFSAFYDQFGGTEDQKVTKEVITFLQNFPTSV